MDRETRIMMLDTRARLAIIRAKLLMMDYEKDPDPENWRTINGSKVHLTNGRIDGGAGGKFSGKQWNGKVLHAGETGRPDQGNLFTGEFVPVRKPSAVQEAKERAARKEKREIAKKERQIAKQWEQIAKKKEREKAKEKRAMVRRLEKEKREEELKSQWLKGRWAGKETRTFAEFKRGMKKNEEEEIPF